MVVGLDDVVEEILSRCHVTDLLRWKSVCKSWNSLISSPSFVELHQKSMCNKKDDINTTRIAMIPCNEYVGGSYSYHMWLMAGSSHGLVCIHNPYLDRIIATNPLTREFRELAQPPYLPAVHCNYGIGFGYDSSTDDYKVVMLTCCYGGDVTDVHMLSLKSNIWKLFGQIKYRCFGDHGILFNGALHWFVRDKHSIPHSKPLIVSFDLVKEEFREIPQPNDSSYDYNIYYKLGLIEGSLCIYMEFFYCKVWVMKNYNGNPSWELLPITDYSKMKKNGIHYMLKDDNQHRKTLPPTYYSDDKHTCLRMRNIFRLQSLCKPLYLLMLIIIIIIIMIMADQAVQRITRALLVPGDQAMKRLTRALLVLGDQAVQRIMRALLVLTRRSSHEKTNKSTVKAWRVKEKREKEEEVRGLVTNTYKNGSKGKERSLKYFWQKKDRVE